MTGGEFRFLKSDWKEIVAAYGCKVECRKVIWRECTNKSNSINEMLLCGSDLMLEDCVFENCNAKYLFYPNEVAHCRFVDCKCTGSELFLRHSNGIFDHGVVTKINSCVAINCSPDPFGEEGWVTQAEFEKASVCVGGK